jgi:hypothetical protein
MSTSPQLKLASENARSNAAEEDEAEAVEMTDTETYPDYLPPYVLEERFEIMCDCYKDDPSSKEFLDKIKVEIQCYTYYWQDERVNRTEFLDAAIGSSQPMSVLYRNLIKPGDSTKHIKKLIDDTVVIPRAAFFWAG